MSEKLNLIFFRMSEDAALVKELSTYYKGKENYNVEFIANGSETNQFLATEGSGILLLEVKTKLDLQNCVTVLKAQRKIIKAGLVKPACILHVKNKKVEKILSKYGCIDLLDEDIKAKTFSFKIDFWSRGLTTLLKKKEKDLELKHGSAKSHDKKEKEKSDFVLVEPLKLQSDIWLFKSKSDYKKILRRWLLRSLGPSPHVGNWVELETQPGDKLPTWKFVLKSDDGQYILEDGAWFFSGSKPDFDWKINRWNFSSDAPHLYFYTNDGQIFSRFKFENGAVTISENSTYALTKEEKILESCDSKFNIEADEAEDESSENFEGESEVDELGGKLDGATDGDEDDLGGHMGGKLKGASDEFEGDIKARSEFDEEEDTGGHYGGKSSTDKVDRDPLSGKGSTDNLENGPLAGKLKPGVNAPGKEKEDKNSSFKEEDTGGHYGGKSSTDKVDRDPLGGKLKTQAPGKEKEDRNSSFKEEDTGGHYGGKSSTDKIDRDPLSGKLKPQAPGKEKESRDASFSEDDLGGHYGGEASTDQVNADPMSGKSSTDKVDRDPLSGKLKPQAPGKEKESRDANFSEDDLGGQYGGEVSTDKVDRDPLSGKGSTDEIDGKPLSGKLKPQAPGKEKESRDANFSEDDLGGHLGGEAGSEPLTSDGDALEQTIDPELLNTPEINPLAHDPELSQEIDDELSRAGLQALDKNGKPIPMSEVAQMSEEELSRAGIKVLDKDGNEIAPEDIAAAIDEELSRAGIKPIAEDIKEKKKEAIEKNKSTSRTPFDSGIKETLIGGKETSYHKQSLAAKPGKELWGDKSNEEEEVPRDAIGRPLDLEKMEFTNKDEAFTQSSNIEGSKSNPFSKKKTAAEIKASEMEEALGGGLSGDVGPLLGKKETEEKEISAPQDQGIVIGEEVEPEKKDKPDLSTILGGDPEVNTEAGDLKVVLKQSTKAGNDITFICNFEDFYEDELIVHAPKDSLAVGTVVKAKVTLFYGGKKVVVFSEGKIEEKEEFNEKKETLVISIANIDKALYEDFMNLYQDRQENIVDFLQKAKGF